MTDETTAHNEAQEVEDAVFAGALATLSSLGLPAEMSALIAAWYATSEATEADEETEEDTNEEAGEIETKTASRTKSFSASIDSKAVGDTGEITAIVSVFGNVDLANDRVMPGAFQASLEEYANAGKSIPFVWSHQWNDPTAYIGKITTAVETSKGLQVTASFYDTPTAQHIRQLLVDGVVTQFSFAYDVLREAKAADGANELLELRILEAGPTLKGCNPLTEILSAKATAAHLKAGRTLSGRNEERLRQATSLLEEVLASVENTDTAKPEEPVVAVATEAKSEEPKGLDSNVALALVAAELAAL